MKVLMVNHPNWMHFQGGDTTTLTKTATALRALGVEVAESHDPEPDAAGCDVAHVFNLRTFEATRRQVEALKRQGVPVVLTPFYMVGRYTAWAALALRSILARDDADAERQRLLALYRSWELTVDLPDGGRLSGDLPNRPLPANREHGRAILGQVDCVLPNSILELDRLLKDLQVPETPFAVVPLDADVETFLGADPEPFRRRYQVRDFVLQVGRLEQDKNQLGLAYALRDLDVPVVLIGQSRDTAYVDLCRRCGPRRLTVLPHLPVEELASAYAAARVHVLANWSETCGLVSLEAAVAGCNLVCSTAGYELEFFRDQVDYCEPLDLASIRGAVERSLANYDRDAPRRQALRERILRDYTWPRVAELTLDVYRKVLDGRAQARRAQ